jgi:hypothetical protein
MTTKQRSRRWKKSRSTRTKCHQCEGASAPVSMNQPQGHPPLEPRRAGSWLVRFGRQRIRHGEESVCIPGRRRANFISSLKLPEVTSMSASRLNPWKVRSFPSVPVCNGKWLQHQDQKMTDDLAMNTQNVRHGTLIFERTCNAPLERVFVAFADVNERLRWGAPSDKTAFIYDEADFREGGKDVFRCGTKSNPQYLGVNDVPRHCSESANCIQ